jgi:hypothetical protein
VCCVVCCVVLCWLSVRMFSPRKFKSCRMNSKLAQNNSNFTRTGSLDPLSCKKRLTIQKANDVKQRYNFKIYSFCSKHLFVLWKGKVPGVCAVRATSCLQTNWPVNAADTNARYWTGTFNPKHIFVRSMITLSSHLLCYLPSNRFPRGFPIKILYVLVVSPS